MIEFASLVCDACVGLHVYMCMLIQLIIYPKNNFFLRASYCDFSVLEATVKLLQNLFDSV